MGMKGTKKKGPLDPTGLTHIGVSLTPGIICLSQDLSLNLKLTLWIGLWPASSRVFLTASHPKTGKTFGLSYDYMGC